MVSIFNYQNYREYLRDYYLNEKDRKTGFTYAKFSETAGIKSPNYFKLVVDGQKNVTAQNVIKFSSALSLNGMETDYFETLVQYNQAKNSLEKEYYQKRLARFKDRGISGNERTLEEYEFEHISCWIHQAILVLTNVDHFHESPMWLKKRLYDLTTEEEVAKALKVLVALGLVRRDKNGRLHQSKKKIITKEELKRISGKLFYKGLLARAIQALDIGTPDDREYSSYVVTLSKRQMPELRRRVREFMKELSEWTLENESPEQVYALTFQGFPLTNEWDYGKEALHEV